MSRQNVIKSSTQSVTVVFLMLGILFFINVLSYRMFVRADLTENKEYTISESTRNVLSELDDIINVTAYFSEDLPPYHANIRTQVEDILAEYKAYSQGNLNIEYVDPSNDEELKSRLARMGIPEVPLGEIKRDKQVISMGFMGIAIQYGDSGEVIPFIRNVNNLEYELTSALVKVKDPTEKIVIWIGPRQMDPQDPNGYKLLQDELNKTYVIRPMEPERLSVIPKRTTLVVVDGSVALPDRALYAVDQYLMDDGQVIFLTDGVALNEGQGLSASEADQNVHALLDHYGVQIEKKLVADQRNARATFNSGYVRFRLPYPFWPKIGRNGFNEENPAVSQLESLVLPWTSPIVLKDPESDTFSSQPLVTTSQVSWVVESPFDLNPQQEWDVTEDDLSRSTLAYELKGSFDSYYKDRPIPADPAASSAGDEQEEEETDVSSDDARMVVIASTRFVNNQFLSLYPENMMFLQNAVDSLAIGNALIGIRSRSVTDRPLSFGTDDEKVIESRKTFHRFMGTFMVPIAVIILGLVRTAIRRRSRKQLEQFSQGVTQ